ncbi:hypothetical protein CLAFUW4_00994 [Fulvia fulva]|uniref:Uncharacterized protein n=1 Tax=Passalora fulva TaxID=5499 RepID=A0A9Q8P2Y8_PASFU|nr:uncharacterized protein CLAFUR5_01000 [Fulvia fulva]KAK4636138.1 hypothetical protein CLAFUR4_00995 [Fulvia fulva]KAK4637631.1 hypothetical protein CLAFUR0_00996 [Fulvia fulva]UJO11445.1 hypothetical protein CLAFUR5_01000 [Fulvia fulva]WPV08335.1 hypothetical protein CLAFUW4_00994 [Fulvia fulva]WPV25147.1 hypothetical protein CLAFUW7_00822 [Fulvia fulva]
MPVRQRRVANVQTASPSKKPRRAKSRQVEEGTREPPKQDDDRESISVVDRQQGSLYDAVAGRLSRDGFILSNAIKQPMPPDQVLFSQKNAPTRYQEDDAYFVHRRLPSGARLPDSDMLKAIHSYASDFYGSGILGKCDEDFTSMDETALIALGVLLEEAASQSLGKTGDLAFVQGEKRG